MTPDDNIIALACIKTLHEMWNRDKTAADPVGDRVFVRWVDFNPDDPGWDDWRLFGKVVDNELVVLGDEEGPVAEAIASGVSQGGAQGRIDHGRTVTWWCRSTLDGPTGARVSDWAKPGGLA